MAEIIATGALTGGRRYLPAGGVAGQYVKNVAGTPTWATESPAGIVDEAGAGVANDIGDATGATTKAKLEGIIEKAPLTTGFTVAGGSTTKKTLTVSVDGDTANIAQATTVLRGTVEIATAAEIVTGTDDTRVPSVKQMKDSLALDGAWLTKRTKMPDGATAVYSQDAWATVDGWATTGAGMTVGVSGGSLVLTQGAGATSRLAIKDVTGLGCGAKTILVKLSGTYSSFRFRADGAAGNITGADIPISEVSNIYSWPIQADTITSIYIQPRGTLTENFVLTIDWIWVGNPTYLAGSLSEEAARIANLRGDMPGSGAYASGTITNNGTTPTDGDTVTIGGKPYTYKTTLGTTEGQVLIGTTEGQVLIGASAAEAAQNLVYAVNYTGTPGTNYYCAAAHPLVSAVLTSSTVITLTAKTNKGPENSIALAKSAATLTLSGTTLLNGITDSAAKTKAELETGYSAVPKFNGIAFPATQVASSDANTLDDYEEGSWTPTLIGSTTAGTQTYTSQSGAYTKIGRLVIARFRIELNAKDAAMAGYAQVNSLPFTASAVTGSYFTGVFSSTSYLTYDSGYSDMGLRVDPGSVVALITESGSGVAAASLPVANVATNTVIRGVLIYTV